MTFSDLTIWVIILGLAVGTFLLRFSFLGLLGDRPLPGWVRRLLRFTPVAVFPAIVAPLVAFPAATGGEPDPARLTAALVALALAVVLRSAIAAIAGGAATLYLMLWLLG